MTTSHGWYDPYRVHLRACWGQKVSADNVSAASFTFLAVCKNKQKMLSAEKSQEKYKPYFFSRMSKNTWRI